MDDFRATPPTTSISTPVTGQAPRVRSDELLRGFREIIIEHRGQEYRLLRTRNDRLILNK